MNLTAKIFLVFSLTVTILLISTLLLVESRAERYALNMIYSEIRLKQTHYKNSLTEYQQSMLRMANIITSDHKFRSFLANIKDNFYPFIAELATETKADYIFMVDDNKQIKATFPDKDVFFQNHNTQLSDNFELERILDEGKAYSGFATVNGQLFNVQYIPLKESKMDESPLAVIVMCNIVDTQWINRFFGEFNPIYHVVFFEDNTVYASNWDNLKAFRFLEQYLQQSKTDLLFQQERYVSEHFSADGGKEKLLFSANLDTAMQPFKQLQQQMLMIGGAIFLLGAAISIVLAKNITYPIRLLVAGTRAVAKGNYSHIIDYQSKDELGRLAGDFNKMTVELKEKELIRNTLNKYVDPEIAHDLLANPEKLKLGGERCQQTILFCDIVGFTTISEQLPATQLVSLLNEYFTLMHEQVFLRKGVLDKFIGDAIMAFWSPLFIDGNLAELACETAIAMQHELQNHKQIWLQKYQTHIETRIGIATGDMVVGNIGSERKWDYTCIGDIVNYSSRLEALNKYYGTRIIVDKKTSQSVSGLVFRELDTVQVKGRIHGESVYELLYDQRASNQKLISAYHKALTIMRKGDYKSAETAFQALADGDAPSQHMWQYCRQLSAAKPKDWSGVNVMHEK